ncbi:MAG: class I SAM-dependent methyltransferase [Myxococcaceae bacterium]
MSHWSVKRSVEALHLVVAAKALEVQAEADSDGRPFEEIWRARVQAMHGELGPVGKQNVRRFVQYFARKAAAAGETALPKRFLVMVDDRAQLEQEAMRRSNGLSREVMSIEGFLICLRNSCFMDPERKQLVVRGDLNMLDVLALPHDISRFLEIARGIRSPMEQQARAALVAEDVFARTQPRVMRPPRAPRNHRASPARPKVTQADYYEALGKTGVAEHLSVLKHPQTRPIVERFLEKVRESAPGGTLIDVGAGAGEVGGLARSQYGLKAIAVEPARSLAERARLSTGVAVRADDRNLPFRGSADAITYLSVLIHHDPADLFAPLRELRRTLKPDGQALVSLNIDTGRHRAYSHTHRFAKGEAVPATQFHVHPMNDVWRAVTRAGWSVVDHETVRPYEGIIQQFLTLRVRWKLGEDLGRPEVTVPLAENPKPLLDGRHVVFAAFSEESEATPLERKVAAFVGTELDGADALIALSGMEDGVETIDAILEAAQKGDIHPAGIEKLWKDCNENVHAFRDHVFKVIREGMVPFQNFRMLW